MIEVNNDFKLKSKKVRQQDVKVTVGNERYKIKQLIYSFDGALFKTIMKQVQITDKTANQLKDKDINFKYGLYINDAFQYVDLGDFYIKDMEDDKKKEEITVTGYDRMIRFMKDFKQSELHLTYPCKMLKLVQRMCEVCGVELYSTDFYNADLDITGDFFTVQELTYRDVLEKVVQTTLTTAFIKENKLYFCKTGNIVVQQLDKSYISNLVIKEKFGPCNALILGRGSVEDNVESTDEESITQNGRYEIRFDENEFVQEQREKVIDNMFEQIKGLEYYSYEASDLGVMWLEPCDCIELGDRNENFYKTYYLKANITLNTGITSNSEADIPDEADTKYKVTSKSEKKTLKVERLAKKNEGLIQDLIQETTENSEKITEHEQTLEGIKDKVSNIEETTNTIDGSNRIVLEKCLTGKLLELHIFGNNTVFDYLALDDELCLSDELYLKGDSTIIVTDENNNVKEYELGVNEVLRQSETTYDEYVLENGKAKVIRRINADGTVKESETVEELGEMLIELAEGTNVITIKNYSANLRAKFVIQNNLTDIYASKVELKSSIEQTASKINLETNKKLEDYSKTTEMNAAIGLESGRINLETNKKLEEYSKTTEITAAIKLSTDEINQKLEKKVDDTTITGAYLVLKINNDKSSGKLSADKVEISASDILNLLAGNTINLTSKSIKISSDNFNVDANGKVKIIDKTAGSITESKAANFTVVSADGKNVSEIIPNRLKITSANASAYFWLTDDWAYAGVTSANGVAKCRMISAGSDLTFIDCTDGTNTSEMTPTGISTPKLTQTSLLKNKKNIEKMQDSALDIIKNIDIYRYNLNSEKDEDKKHLGFVISEKYNYSKEVTSTDNKGVDNYSFTSLCCKAIQELIQKIEQLQEKIKKMEETS